MHVHAMRTQTRAARNNDSDDTSFSAAHIIAALRFFAALPLLCKLASSLRLQVAPNGGNASSPLLYGLLYEEIYHSGDGGLYGEMIRNRAFQGRLVLDGGPASRETGSSGIRLMYQMRMDVPEGTTGPVGFYNDGFWGFHVDASKEYAASFYLRCDYGGGVECFFTNTLTGEKLSSAKTEASQDASQEWVQHHLPTFQPLTSASTPNNTFSFVFDGSRLVGQSVYVNLLSLFKKTCQNRDNGLREDLAQTLADLKASWICWNETIGPLEERVGKLGVWGNIETQGFGLVEQMRMARYMDLTVVLGIFNGLYFNGDLIPEDELQPYMDSAMDSLEFLTYPVFVGEYASIREGSATGPETGAQTFGMPSREAIMLLGIERNSYIILEFVYGALIKQYDENPNTVAVIKHTANEILRSMSYYLQQLSAAHVGTDTLPAKATEGGLGPVWWSATKAGRRTVLKMVNYNGGTGAENSVKVQVKGSRACTTELTAFTA
ncbi:uncharacterized protein J7T54_007931 [Emericellopsis cladophorae]|uniref:Alpha-L-arabinofuranosidase 1 catalytic domain-containing protein n=1 Tax=Emericellopsis cladophorae TaxID=2686198 RepID=A0A9Q0BGT2_9HYPO|nr:uncharacterized protein J7T54_007931 [Emericellopsis cladophorae]KAI6784837.1 hypothetical protein J7T54_007931 [Emericellopsis cladophorae]